MIAFKIEMCAVSRKKMYKNTCSMTHIISKNTKNNILCLHIFKGNARDRTCPSAFSQLSFPWFR